MIYTTKTAAEALNVSVRHIDNLCYRNKLTFTTFGRGDRLFTQEEIDRYKQQRDAWYQKVEQGQEGKKATT